MTKTNPTLAEDLIGEILARLLVKSLVRFKRVSKSWYALISSDAFVKKHLTCFTSRSQNKLLLIHTFTEKLRPVSLFTKYNPNPQAPPSLQSEVLHVPFLDNLSECRIVGCSNGLICLTLTCEPGYRDLYLWNPAINHLKLLPPCSDLLRVLPWELKMAFGIDPNSGHYKVVLFSNPENRSPSVESAYVYKEGAAVGDSGGRWRCNRKAHLLRGGIFIWPRPHIQQSDHGSDYMTVNGMVHWKADTRENGRRHNNSIIVCFDLRKEVFNVIDIPKVFICADNVNNRPYWHPMSLGESLGLFVYRIGFIDVWQMNKCDDQVSKGPSWTRLYSVQSFKENISRDHQCHHGEENSVVVVEVVVVEEESSSPSGEKVHVYVFDVKARQFKKVLTSRREVSWDQVKVWSIHGYAESLVPLRGKLMYIEAAFVCC